MYFNKFPKIDYTFQNGQTVPVVDVFRKVSLSQESLNTSNIFIDIVNGTGRKPESIAQEYYGNPELSWLLFLSNQTVNPSLEWNVDFETFNAQMNAKYNGKTYYIPFTNDAQVGDIAISITLSIDYETSKLYINSINTNKYTLITNVNKEFRSFSGVAFTSSFAGGENITILRKNSDGKYRPLMDSNEDYVYYRIEKAENYLTAPHHFEVGNVIVSPYRIVNPNNSQITDYTASNSTNSVNEPTNFTDTSTIFNTILYNYMTGNPLPVGLKKITNQQLELSSYNESTKIKIINPQFVYPLVELFNNTLNSDTAGRTKQIELNI
jgi:hypothetical protein